MQYNPWLPIGYTVTDSIKTSKVIFASNDWQIYSTNGLNSILFADSDLFEFWKSLNLNLEAFNTIEINDRNYYYVVSPNSKLLQPIANNKKAINFTIAKNFIEAIKKHRKKENKLSLHNCIFVEDLKLVLPMRPDGKLLNDEIVIGKWISSGVNISIGNTDRIKQLVTSLKKQELEELQNMLKHTNNLLLVNKTSSQSPENNETNFNTIKNKEPFALPGRIELETFFKEHVIDIIENAEEYKNMGIEFPSSFILQGPPGCGKTYAVEKLTEYLDWPVYRINSANIGSPFIHETGKKISETFDEAIENAPSVLIIDEMESFLSTRNDHFQGHHLEEMAEFLRRIPEAIAKHVLIAAMTNVPDIIDPAITRKGRFDHIIEVDMPSPVEVAMVINNALNKLPHEDNINVEEISKTLAGKSMADTAFVIREAARLTAKNHLKVLKQSTFDSIIKSLKKDNTATKPTIGFNLKK